MMLRCSDLQSQEKFQLLTKLITFTQFQNQLSREEYPQCVELKPQVRTSKLFSCRLVKPKEIYQIGKRKALLIYLKIEKQLEGSIRRVLRTWHKKLRRLIYRRQHYLKGQTSRITICLLKKQGNNQAHNKKLLKLCLTSKMMDSLKTLKLKARIL